MKNFLKISLSSIFIIHSTIGLDSIIETAYRTNTLTKKALDEEREFRRVTAKQLDALSENIKKAAEDFSKAENPVAWQKKVLELIARDKEATTKFDTQLKAVPASISVPFSVKTHKIKEILEGTEKLIQSSFFDLLDGKLPVGYGYAQETITLLGGQNEATGWGNSRITFLKTAFIYMLATKEEGVVKKFGSMDNILSLDDSALLHIAPLPENIGEGLDAYSFISSYQGNKLGLIFPHSGYAFGGHRGEQRYAAGKRFGPQDCSSGIAYLMESPAYSTADQLCAYRILSKTGGLVPNGWENGADAKYLLSNTTIIDVKDPQKDIQPGQIYMHRRFAQADATMKETLGIGGHTAIALGFLNENVVTLGYNRDMPALEGFGIQNFSWAPEPLKLKVIFKPSSPVQK